MTDCILRAKKGRQETWEEEAETRVILPELRSWQGPRKLLPWKLRGSGALPIPRTESKENSGIGNHELHDNLWQPWHTIHHLLPEELLPSLAHKPERSHFHFVPCVPKTPSTRTQQGTSPYKMVLPCVTNNDWCLAKLPLPNGIWAV